MTRLLDDLADHLAAHLAGSLVVGRDIVKSGFSDLPIDAAGTPAPDTQLALHAYPGLAPDQVMGPGNPSPVVNPNVQVVARARTYVVASDLAQAAYDVLAPIVDTLINGTRYLRIEAIQEPFHIGNDQNARTLIACNYQVSRER